MGMNASQRVAVAMSGGLDSSMAAALLMEQGCRVEGLTMRLWTEREDAGEEAIASARGVCRALGIPHHVQDLRQLFYGDVVGRFVREYSSGRTPNPCVRCNRLLKFGELLAVVQRLGIDSLATGHYARVDRVAGRYRLRTGRDPRKDQSYFLYTLGQRQLASLTFPLGDLTKDQVRDLARARGLPVAERAESQDVCFIPDGSSRRFLGRWLPTAASPGPILAADGRMLGQHHGLPYYTVGQREGLGIAAPQPLYVTSIDVGRNALFVGSADEATASVLEAEDVSFVSGQPPPNGAEVEVRVRYRALRLAAHVSSTEGGRWRVALSQATRGIAPGQAVVFYLDDEVLGGGTIARTGR